MYKRQAFDHTVRQQKTLGRYRQPHSVPDQQPRSFQRPGFPQETFPPPFAEKRPDPVGIDPLGRAQPGHHTFVVAVALAQPLRPVQRIGAGQSQVLL